MEIKGLRKIEPYVAGSQPAEKNIIKLNTNENAYGPSPAVHQALASFDAHQLRKYSTLDQAALRQALSEQLGVPADQVIIGNGSDDILSMAFLAFFNSCTCFTARSLGASGNRTTPSSSNVTPLTSTRIF